MIEIEKKFQASEEVVKHIEINAHFVKEEVLTDIYFDYNDYRLTSNNFWLRNRNGVFELKAAIRGPQGSIDRYAEITDHGEIASYIHSDLAYLSLAGIHPFASFKTTRRKYHLDSCAIDIDIGDFGDFTHRVVEIERLVDTEDQIPEAEKSILDLADRLSLDTSKKVGGKLIAYLSARRPAHYQALKQAGVVS